MRKQRRPWGLMGLLGLGGLMMMGASRDDDQGGGSGDGPGGDEPGGDEPSSDNPGWPDLPPPPTKPKPRPGLGDPKPGPTKPPIHLPTQDDDPPDPLPVENDPPWSELLGPYPRGARFYPVHKEDRFGGTSSKHSIAYRFLLSEAYLAAMEHGDMPHDDAIAWALAVGKQDKVRLAVIDLIQCSGWNDAMYGSEPINVSHASAHGRSIRLTPVHGPTEALLSEGNTPVRNITLTGKPSNGDYREYELLWQPAIDRSVLWESGGVIVTTTNMLWADGTSMENPPPWVMALSIEDLSGELTGDFGCPGSDGELEVE